jgi:hypothetical protein
MRYAEIVADCNALVVNVPTFEYWQCICQGYRDSLSCYQICAEDANLQLQLDSQRQNTFSRCNYVEEMKQQGLGAPPAIDTSIANASSHDTNELQPQTTKVLPPLTPLPSLNHSFMGNVTLQENMSSSLILDASLLTTTALFLISF